MKDLPTDDRFENDVRFGHDLGELQDATGVDLLLLKRNLACSVEERLLALEDFIRFADAVRSAPKGP